jgi:osmotically-inducible protein OsmY
MAFRKTMDKTGRKKEEGFVFHGVVNDDTLGGKARNAAEKDLVSKLVTDIKGVKSVNNLMTIEESK